MIVLHFNSIKVQLKPSKECQPLAAFSFQFHKGTIKTSDAFVSTKLSKIFQFHKGTIKTIQIQQPSAWVLQFQFHKGTIKTSCKYLCGNVTNNFNSIKVQLKPIDSSAARAFPQISIP